MIKLKLSILCIFFSFCTHTYAERVARFIYINASGSAPKEVAILQEEFETANLKVLPKNFAAPFELAEKGIEIVVAPKGTVKDEEGRWRRFPKVKFPSNWEKVIIFLFENNENSLFPVRGVAIDASDGAYEEGAVIVMNLSEAFVLGRIGDREVKSKPKSRVMVKKPLKEKGSLNVSMDMKIAASDKVLRLVRRVIWWTGKSKTLLVVLPAEEGGYPKFHMTTLADSTLTLNKEE